MSNTEPTQKIEVIPYDSIIKVEVSGAYYARFHQLFISYISQKSPEEFAKILAELKDREPATEYEHNVVTLLSFIKEIELKAKEQSQTKMEEMALPNQSPKVDPDKVSD